MPPHALNTASVTRPGAFLGRITSQIRDLAARSIAPSGKGLILDVACGNGLFFATLDIPGGRLIGIDVDLGLLREARNVFADNRVSGIRLVQGDAAALPFRDNTFDSIFFLNTLVNIPDDRIVRRLLSELMRLCRPGGRIFLDIRNAANPLLRLRYWWYNRRETFITRGYHMRHLAGIFEPAGFYLAARRPIGPRLPFGPFAYFLEIRRGPGKQAD